MPLSSQSPFPADPSRPSPARSRTAVHRPGRSSTFSTDSTAWIHRIAAAPQIRPPSPTPSNPPSNAHPQPHRALPPVSSSGGGGVGTHHFVETTAPSTVTWRPSGAAPGPVAASRVRSWSRPAPTRPCGPGVRAAPAAAVRTGPSGTGRRRASSRGAASPRASGRQAGVVAGPGAHRVLEGQPGRGLAAPTRLLACNYTSLAAPTTCARPSPLSFANLTAKICSSFLEQEREKDASISSSEQHGLCSLQSPRSLRLAAGARGMYFWDQSARVLSMLPLASPAPQAGVAVPAISSRGPARLVCCATSSRMKSASRSLTPFPVGVCYGETARQRPRQTASLGRRDVVSFEALPQMITSSSFVSSAFLRIEDVDTGLQQ